MAGNIDGSVFRRFAVYDSFVRKKGWRNPVIFGVFLERNNLVHQQISIHHNAHFHAGGIGCSCLLCHAQNA